MVEGKGGRVMGVFLQVIGYLGILVLFVYGCSMLWVGSTTVHDRKIKYNVSVPTIQLFYYTLLPKKRWQAKVNKKLHGALISFRQAEWSFGAATLISIILVLSH